MSLDFDPTDWTVISRARSLPDDHADRRAALESIAERYQEPVRAMMRAWGVKNDHDLDDAAQDFFLKFLEKNWIDLLRREKGRFRGFLRTAIHHFLIDRKRAQKPVHAALPDDDLLAAPTPTPEEVFDRAWAEQLMAEAVDAFRETCAHRALPHYWTVFERHVLVPPGQAPSIRATADRLGIDEKIAANHLYRARRLFAEKMREAVRRTVNGSEKDVAAELDHLRGVVG